MFSSGRIRSAAVADEHEGIGKRSVEKMGQLELESERKLVFKDYVGAAGDHRESKSVMRSFPDLNSDNVRHRKEDVVDGRCTAEGTQTLAKQAKLLVLQPSPLCARCSSGA